MFFHVPRDSLSVSSAYDIGEHVEVSVIELGSVVTDMLDQVFGGVCEVGGDHLVSQ